MIERLVAVVVLTALVTVVGAAWRLRQGRVVPVTGATRRHDDAPAVASALLFTTPTCRWCPAVREALEQVAARAPWFTWRELDATTAVDAVRRHRVLRAPTVLFLDGDAVVIARASGPLGADEVARAVGVELPRPVRAEAVEA